MAEPQVLVWNHWKGGNHAPRIHPDGGACPSLARTKFPVPPRETPYPGEQEIGWLPVRNVTEHPKAATGEHVKSGH
jgi:hypothetical protein